jgi:hypothetical protein
MMAPARPTKITFAEMREQGVCREMFLQMRVQVS